MSESAIATAYERAFPGEVYPGEEAALEFLVAEILMNRDILTSTGVEGEVRLKNEIQHAHDLLAGALLDPVIRASLTATDSHVMHGQVAVLCWVLHHEHNKAFTGFIDVLMGYLRGLGTTVVAKSREDTE